MMPSNERSNNKYSDYAADMSSNLKSRQSSRQRQNSKTTKEKVISRHENQSLNRQGKLEAKTCVVPPYSYLPHEIRREADDKVLVQPKSSRDHLGQCVKGKAAKDEELVKYMSNLPGYLQRMEGGENLKDKALNVGVLDFSRLEKWKYNQNSTQARGSNNASSTSSSLSLKTTTKSSTFSSVAEGGTHAHQSEQQSSFCPSIDTSHKNGLSRSVKPSTQKVLRFQDFETTPKTNLGGDRKMQWTYKSFGRTNADVTLKKGKAKESDQKITSEMGNLSTSTRNHGVALNPKDKVSAWGSEVKNRVEETQESNINRRALDQKIISKMRASSPKLKTYGVLLGSKEQGSAGNVETKSNTEKLQESNTDLGHPNLPGKLENVAPLLPRELSQNGSLEDSTVILLDENSIKASQNSFSDSSPLEEVCSAKLCSDIPHSCPLPSKVQTNLMAQNVINSQSVEVSPDPSYMSPYSSKSSSMLSEGKDAAQNTMKHMNTNEVENLKILDQDMAEISAIKGRCPSPNRRFSFGLGRMGRSVSLKESSSLPKLSSTYVSVKSGPVKSEEAFSLDDSYREKTNGHSRGRSSPLRRLLNPLLRSKGSIPVHAAETVQPLKENSTYHGTKSLHNEKHETSTIQALLQLTVKNGVPLFKFVVDNNSSVLAAAVKNLTSSEKCDSRQNYTFYAVDEIKRKSGGWISHGSKVKSCGYVSNVIGQMKVSRSHFSDLIEQKLGNQYVVRESVLFGAEQQRQADQAYPNFMPGKELAAVVVKIPTENSSHHTQQSDKDGDTFEKGLSEWSPGDGCYFNSGENNNSYNTTVILPDGVHTMPNKGAPSPLIDRWKSGGTCDCGGWDVGCKLRVLANHSESHKFPGLNPARFELFLQGGDQQNKPIFSLVPLNKELYSVEFSSSVSFLQAFFICVTVISCRKSSDLAEVSSLYEAKNFQEDPMININGEVFAKYVPNPPHSPVGRV